MAILIRTSALWRRVVRSDRPVMADKRPSVGWSSGWRRWSSCPASVVNRVGKIWSTSRLSAIHGKKKRRTTAVTAKGSHGGQGVALTRCFPSRHCMRRRILRIGLDVQLVRQAQSVTFFASEVA